MCLARQLVKTNLLQLPNFYDKIYIVCYPPGAGGNFLINCLALSEHCVFSNAYLASEQLAGRFDTQAKISYLASGLDQAEQSKTWNDLNLGNGQLFGIDCNEVQNTFIEILNHKINSVVGDAIDADKRIFFVCHNILIVPTLQKIWPDSKLILFINFAEFIRQRPKYAPKKDIPKELSDYWNTVRDSTWPKYPPRDHDEFSELPEYVRDELMSVHKFNISRWFDFDILHDKLWHDHVRDLHQKNFNSSCVWDTTQNYANIENLMLGLCLLRSKFEFELVDQGILEWYFNRWKTVITQTPRDSDRNHMHLVAKENQ